MSVPSLSLALRSLQNSEQLPFESGPGSLPRLSVADALLGIQDIATANSTVIQHGRQHLGKTLRCGFLP